MVKIIKEPSPLGATIKDIDLSKEIPPEDQTVIKEALARYQVLFFRDQDITPKQHKDFANIFGALQSHPVYPTIEGFPEITILENDKLRPSKIEEWHTDMTFKSIPPLGSILIGKIIPKLGGDTLFASLSAAYNDLPDTLKERLDKLTATHSFAYGFKESLEEAKGKKKLEKAVKNNPPVIHPVIRTHPETGNKLIFVNSLFTEKINGVTTEESNELLEFLCNHIKKEEYVCRFKWKNNSIAFWDNRSVIHKPENDYWPQLRRMERITIDDISSPK
ncbi:MAG: TauD/TfdA family dioxygenase [SAR86 cluster bacterium]|nr:TauD/TfdA family dioxygenase [SAR86 cluster bacterium]